MDKLHKKIESDQNVDKYCEVSLAVTPLKKRTRSGDVYVRVPEIEILISELSVLSRDELIARARIGDRGSAKYIPSECLVYFIRAWRQCDDVLFESLYRILIERVLRGVRRADSRNGGAGQLDWGNVRDHVYNRFVELLASDRIAYVDKLDFFEVRFDGAVANLRRDAQKQVRRDKKRFQALEYDGETNELSPQVERAAGAFDTPDAFDLDDPAYRLRFEEAIRTLPPEQARIIHMLMLDFPIDSKEPDVMTISKALGRCEKTIRTYRDKAFAALRVAMAKGEEQ